MSRYCAGGSTNVFAQLISFPFSMATESVTGISAVISTPGPPRSPDDCSHAHPAEGPLAWPIELMPFSIGSE